MFAPGVVTPELQNEAVFAEVLRRMKLETGRWDKVSILLPDSWFRMNIIELQALPERANEAAEVIRWSLRRTMPIDPSELRLSYEVLSRVPPRILAVVMVLQRLEGLSDREASFQLQLPEATFRARLQSAYEILRCDAKTDFSKAREQYRDEKE